MAEFLIGPSAHDERQMNESLITHRGDGHAIGGHDQDLAVALPQGEGLPLLDLDQEPVRVELGDGCFLYERKLLQPFPDFRDIKEQERIARPYPGKGEKVLFLEFALARDRHGFDGKAERLGNEVGGLSLCGNERGIMAAFHGAVAAHGRKQRQGQTSARARPSQPVQDFMPQAQTLLARGRHQSRPLGKCSGHLQSTSIGQGRRACAKPC